jgi:UDP-N-acetylglucosamine enolpyruvyl transferase
LRPICASAVLAGLVADGTTLIDRAIPSTAVYEKIEETLRVGANQRLK